MPKRVLHEEIQIKQSHKRKVQLFHCTYLFLECCSWKSNRTVSYSQHSEFLATFLQFFNTQ